MLYYLNTASNWRLFFPRAREWSYIPASWRTGESLSSLFMTTEPKSFMFEASRNIFLWPRAMFYRTNTPGKTRILIASLIEAWTYYNTGGRALDGVLVSYPYPKERALIFPHWATPGRERTRQQDRIEACIMLVPRDQPSATAII